jgi:hypothetical protein
MNAASRITPMYHNVFTVYNDERGHLPNWPATMIAASGWWEYPQPLNENWEEHTRMGRLMAYTDVPHNPWYVWSEGQLVFGAIPDPHFPHRSWPYGGWPLALLNDFNASNLKVYAGSLKLYADNLEIYASSLKLYAGSLKAHTP